VQIWVRDLANHARLRLHILHGKINRVGLGERPILYLLVSAAYPFPAATACGQWAGLSAKVLRQR
jgi:hypothetical protein